MLDIKLIRESPEIVRKDLEKRGDEEKKKLLEDVIAWDREWRTLLKQLNADRHRRNVVSQEISKRKKRGEDASSLIKEATDLPKRIKHKEERVDELRKRIDHGLMRLPNILHESVPIGKDDSDNVEERRWGEIRKIDFDLKAHGELMERLGIADFERARKISGTGFVFMRGELVLLDQALINFALDYLMKQGYTPVEPPFAMRRKAYEGVTDLADFEDVMYKLEEEDLYLIATSEHPIGAMYMDEIIDEESLPLKYVGVSTNFRKEIGAHGVDTKGLFRMHQFNKVEQFIFCKPEDSWHFHEELICNAEALFQMMKIPYRIVNDCTGDIGTVAAKKYDLEAWSPRQKKYVEVVSCSNCTDYQARRLNIRCGKVGGEKRILHTLNSTAIATSRALVAILENYQNSDGSVTIPEVLRPYMHNIERIEPKKQ
ncbi:MAG: serine--tRNA ligase [Thermoplasmata archaeon]